MITHDDIRQALAGGPATAAWLAERLHVTQGRIGHALAGMSHPTSGVVCIGTLAAAQAAGVSVNNGWAAGDRPGRYNVYALAGTAKLPAAPDEPVERKPGSKAGSGVVAGRKVIRGYLW